MFGPDTMFAPVMLEAEADRRRRESKRSCGDSRPRLSCRAKPGSIIRYGKNQSRKEHCPVNADQEIESVTTLQIAEKTLILFWKKTRFLILI